MSASPPHHQPLLGLSLKLSSIFLLGGMRACIKALGAAVPTGQVVFVRCFIAVLAIAAVAHFSVGLQILKTANWRQHALRSMAGTCSMFCLFAALTLIPIADMTAIGFTTPMYVTLLAMLVLGERIHTFRWSALGIGFVGVLIIIGPYLNLRNAASLGALIASVAALSSAVALVILRRMSQQEHAITITFYFMLTAMTCALLTLPWGWVMPNAQQLGWLLLTGVLGAAGQLLLNFSFRYAEASTLVPLDYADIILAVLIGYFLFNELPNPSTWLGAPLVIVAGLIIFWREYQLLRQRRQPIALAATE